MTTSNEHQIRIIDLTEDSIAAAVELEVIDLTRDICLEYTETSRKRPFPFNVDSAGLGTDAGLDDLEDRGLPESHADLSFYCARCNGGIEETAVLRKCGCLYCGTCNDNIVNRWRSAKYECNLTDHTKYGRHRGRKVFALDRNCPICQEGFGSGETICLECALFSEMAAKRRKLSFLLRGEIYDRRLVVDPGKQLAGAKKMLFEA
ncbi:hypothetical protein PCL_08371 [Purpureocillium lilacinum]|uniref:Uncharacterized protein n=1 Tax=Purpureocillium lilacinum TaxID=33203 RepID=A0A2U3DRZ9_PURLI|nr:hypothetical protein PCL_08371 [Purpureocillium lilacinum]